MSLSGATSLASLDGEIMPASAATISVTDDGLVRGDGAFEVIRVYDGLAFAMDEHLARLQRSGRNLRLAIDLEAVRADANRLLARAGPGQDHECLRIMITRGGRRILLTEPLPPVCDQARCKTITYAPTRILDGIKSLSYASNMLARRLAQEQGFDEALLVTPHGRVLEGQTNSVFWVRDGELFTPSLEDHILASITRAMIIELTGAMERPCTLQDLTAAEEVFLASTVREVQPVSAVDEHPYAAPGPVTERAAAAAAQRIRSELDS
ncbi:MAG: aminotransferase class IV family protein [Solirubrobacterales bacterium]|nr:aminotransferase class IV family protein [Solirubrobacterales bacterium]